ncbi:MAG: hypothetical protein F4Y94_05420 [Chloroflexi bacterium]|nr:hypothetical protein [Chloroflexota bacterium]
MARLGPTRRRALGVPVYARGRASRSEPIAIEGLHEFLRDLAAVDTQLRRDFNKVLRTAADPMVAAAHRYYMSGNPASPWPFPWGVTGRSLSGIKAETHFGGVAFRLGGGRYRYLLGQEWGALPDTLDSRGRRLGGRFGPPRGRWHGGGGTFYYPAWLEGIDDAEAEIATALDRATATLAGHSAGAARLAGHLNLTARAA